MTAPDRWFIGMIVSVALLVAGWFGVMAYGAHCYDAGRAAAVADRAAQDAVAVLNRTKENATTAASQAQTNSIVTKVKNEELAPVRERIVTQRVYVGSAICDGPSAAPQAESTAGGDSTNPPGRLVRPDVERDLVALKMAVEEDLATGRACQAFIEKNGLVP